MREFNPSQIAMLDLVTKLKDEGQPDSNIMDALLFLGATLLAGSGLPKENVERICDVVRKVATEPNHPMVREFMGYLYPS